MTLRLRIVSEQRRSLGERASLVLGPAGATIGRSADNDWVLPDPLRYVSAHHARIVFRDGQYFFEDVSTNGSYVNDSKDPLAKAGPHALRSGDLLRLGEYHIAVAVEVEPVAPRLPAGADSDASGVPTSINALRAIPKAAQTDIGAQLNLEELLVDEPLHSSAPRPTPGAESFLSDEPTDSAIQRRIARLAKAVERAPRPNGSAAASPAGDSQNGVLAFCRGAGVDPERLPPEVQARLMHLVGQLLREALVGLKDLYRARNEIRNHFRIETPAEEPDDPRPSLGHLTVEELMTALFTQHETRSIDAVQWLRDALGTAKEHEARMPQAMRAAFVEFLDRLDPKELEARFERAARRGNTKAADRAQYWELYQEFYRSLIEMPVDHLPHTFVEAFAKAYREMAKKP